jgi:hypothetical protein
LIGFAGFFGERSRPTTMILIEEVPDGGYYRAQEIITTKGLKGTSGLAQASWFAYLCLFRQIGALPSAL